MTMTFDELMKRFGTVTDAMKENDRRHKYERDTANENAELSMLNRIDPQGKPVKPKKERRKKVVDREEDNIMNGNSELKKNKTGKWRVETEMKIKPNLDMKTKRALHKSIKEEARRAILGGRLNDGSSSDDSSSDDEIIVKRKNKNKK